MRNFSWKVFHGNFANEAWILIKVKFSRICGKVWASFTNTDKNQIKIKCWPFWQPLMTLSLNNPHELNFRERNYVAQIPFLLLYPPIYPRWTTTSNRLFPSIFWRPRKYENMENSHAWTRNNFPIKMLMIHINSMFNVENVSGLVSDSRRPRGPFMSRSNDCAAWIARSKASKVAAITARNSSSTATGPI